MTELGHEAMEGGVWTRNTEIQHYPPLSSERDVDTVVIGAGYTGLFAAHTLLDAGQKVVILDSKQPGWAASGRNAGHVGALFWGAKKTPKDMVKTFGSDLGARMNQLVAGSGEWLFDFIEHNNINCSARRGYLTVQRSEASHTKAKVAFAEWTSYGGRYESVCRADVIRRTGSARYAGGIWLPDGGTVNPYALVKGLANTVTAKGGELYGNSCAHIVERKGTRWRIKTAEGSVVCDQILIGAGAYPDALFPALRQTSYQLYCAVVATAPLTDAGRAYMPEDPVFMDMDDQAIFAPMIDADNRLIASFLLGPGTPDIQSAKKIIGRRFERAFAGRKLPDFETLTIGKFTATPDGAPHIVKLDENIYAATGCNGLGLTLGVTAARELARFAMEQDEKALGVPVVDAAPVSGAAFVPKLMRWGIVPLANRLSA